MAAIIRACAIGATVCTLRYALHIIPILSPVLFIPSLYSPFLSLKNVSFTSLPSFFMHACIYKPSVFVFVVYKHVMHVRHHGIEPQ